MAEKKDDEGKLKRLGGGRWQTPDERFTIEPQSGTWSLVDAEQSDDLGLPLVRGPFRSLTEAKEAIASARSGAPAASPLAAAKAPSKPDRPTAAPAPSKGADKAKRAGTKSEPEPEPEPRWITDLDADDRRRARRLITRLEAIGAKDAEGIVRRDVAGGVPTIARLAVAEKLAAAVDDPASDKTITKLLDVLIEGRDEALDVRWRLVDDDGRPVGLSRADLDAARDRRKRRD